MNDLLNEISEKVVHKEQWNKVKEYMIELQKENERLNNIIDDFVEELEREISIKEENTSLEHNTYIDIKSTLKAVLKRFKELKGE